MRQMKHDPRLLFVAMLIVTIAAGACAKKVPPVAKPAPPGTVGATAPPPGPPEPVSEPTVVPPMPIPEDAIGAKSLDDLNRDSPLKPVFFPLDSSEIGSEGQATLQENASVLKQYATWQITIEGHCDERGSAEYNLALGERRALAARDYLVSLGIPATRVRTVSYGKEFPFDPGQTEEAFSKNRRAHFVITAK
ncbi:MAG TPA: peptidoglycan-associated lipoprotein Pal [Vicinamibacterales bacterium]|nr:peptidoglycan-associated lipoprotein Pal [Vicinamibacterales bacterium]